MSLKHFKDSACLQRPADLAVTSSDDTWWPGVCWITMVLWSELCLLHFFCMSYTFPTSVSAVQSYRFVYLGKIYCKRLNRRHPYAFYWFVIVICWTDRVIAIQERQIEDNFTQLYSTKKKNVRNTAQAAEMQHSTGNRSAVILHLLTILSVRAHIVFYITMQLWKNLLSYPSLADVCCDILTYRIRVTQVDHWLMNSFKHYFPLVISKFCQFGTLLSI